MGGLMTTMSHIWTRFILHWKVCFLCNSWALALLKNCFCYLKHRVLKINAVNPPTNFAFNICIICFTSEFISHWKFAGQHFRIAADICKPLTLWLSIEIKIRRWLPNLIRYQLWTCYWNSINLEADSWRVFFGI